jgi:uncharacterized protein (TIGR02001 family)
MSIIKSASWGAASLIGAALFAGPALADGMPSRGKVAAAPESRTCSTSANVGLTTDYVFRGASQNNEDAAIQGGVDFSCGRFYFGFWGSSSQASDNGTEVDVYAGVKGKIGAISWDLGGIYYAYPGQSSGIDADFFELKASASGDVWRGGNLTGTVFYSPDYAYSSGPVTTLEATFAQTLPKVGMFSPTFSATVGHSFFSDDNKFGEDPSYTYWNAGVSLGFAEKWSLDLRYWDTSSDADIFTDSALVGDRYVATLKYTF